MDSKINIFQVQVPYTRLPRTSVLLHHGFPERTGRLSEVSNYKDQNMNQTKIGSWSSISASDRCPPNRTQCLHLLRSWNTRSSIFFLIQGVVNQTFRVEACFEWTIWTNTIYVGGRSWLCPRKKFALFFGFVKSRGIKRTGKVQRAVFIRFDIRRGVTHKLRLDPGVVHLERSSFSE